MDIFIFISVKSINRRTEASSQWNKLNPHAWFLYMRKVCKWCLLYVYTITQTMCKSWYTHKHTYIYMHTYTHTHTDTHVNVLRRNKCEKLSWDSEFKDHWPHSMCLICYRLSNSFSNWFKFFIADRLCVEHLETISIKTE